MACNASELALASSSSPAPKLMRARIIAKLPAPRGNSLRSDFGVDAIRRCLRSSPGARRSKLPWSSAHDQPASVSATPSVSETNGTTSSAAPQQRNLRSKMRPHHRGVLPKTIRGRRFRAVQSNRTKSNVRHGSDRSSAGTSIGDQKAFSLPRIAGGAAHFSSNKRRGPQSLIASTPSRLASSTRSRIACSTSGGCGSQSVISPTTRSGSRVR